jgi:hypothetical protein
MGIGPPGSHIDKKAREMNPVRFEEDEFIPVNIRFDLDGPEGSSIF